MFLDSAMPGDMLQWALFLLSLVHSIILILLILLFMVALFVVVAVVLMELPAVQM